MSGNKFLIAALSATLLFACAERRSPEAVFDFEHIDLALRFFESGDSTLPEKIAATDAALHLKRHSDRTGYYPPGASALEITLDLMKNTPSDRLLAETQTLVNYAKANQEKQRACLAEAEAYLPEEAGLKHPLYITYGYDIGVAMDGRASLNLAHPHFLADRDEVWFYCTHEGHHAGLMQLHPMPQISSIETVPELYDFVRYATFLEGLAVYAAWETRDRAGALQRDRDYANLEDPAKLKDILGAYWKNLADLEKDFEAPLGDRHWQMIEAMSSGDRLWYVTGAEMARTIDQTLGRGGLKDFILAGPDAFFETYEKIQGGQPR